MKNLFHKTINDSNLDLEKSTTHHIKQVSSGSSESDETSENRPPTKQEQVETTFLQVQIKESQVVFKCTQLSSATLQEETSSLEYHL